MVVLDGTVKSKALACLVFSKLLLVLAQKTYLSEIGKLSAENLAKGTIIQEEEEEEEKDNNILKINRQITVFLPKKEIKVYQYVDVENQDHNFSVTVIPCLTTIKWSLVYRNFEEIKKVNYTALLENKKNVDAYKTSSLKTITIKKAKKGFYYVIFYPGEEDSSASVYVTMDDGGPYELSIVQNSNMILTPQRRQKLKVTWDQSLVNPQNTSYCLVVNTKKEYSSLCGAEEEGPTLKGFDVPVIVNLNNLRIEKKENFKYVKLNRGMKHNNDTLVVCVDRKMQLTFTKLKKGVKYYFNLFAINNKTNLTIPYGKSYIEYNFTIKPVVLKDGIKKLVDLRKLEGKALFRYKANDTAKELHFYVLACGGAVDVEVKAKRSLRKRGKKAKDFSERLPKQARVFGYKRFRINSPVQGEQFYLKINAPNIDELTRIKYVEVFMTMYPTQKYPLPLLPEEPNLYEFKSQKTCNSVTIGWIPVYDTSVNTYCVTVWENGKFNYADLFRGYYQCNLDEVPKKKSFFFSKTNSSTSRVCEDMITKTEKSITNYKIRDLKPKTSYTIQVTVKKKNGRTLSYKFLKVNTKHSCEY